ncbi:hypothetical protein [Solicola sp. PLA-1-18]|uniref:hypothetical protein n=1 Tax=Solicola sp. PLA-1-18 TaxID=3380532 RepID=UPI003B7AED5C
MSQVPQMSDGVRMWGHELLSWSDARPGHTESSAALLVSLLAEPVAADARVLLAGPHDAELLHALAARAGSVDVVLRSWPDAAAVAARDLGDHVRAHCGGWDRFVPDAEGYDVVLLPDGLARVWGPESDVTSWDVTVGGLLAVLRPGGEVVLGLDNALAGHVLWSSGPEPAAGGDDEWPLPAGTRPTPAGVAEVVAAFAGAEVVSLFPHVRHPTVAVSGRALAEASDPRLRRVLVDSFVADAERPVLHRDPRPLVDLVLDQGLGEALAPGWLVRLRRDAAVEETTAGSVHVSEVVHGPYFGCTTAITVGPDGSWTRRLSGRAPEELAAGPLARDLGALDGSIPTGRTLEESVLVACAAHDLPAIRRVVRTYVAWLDSQSTEADWSSPWNPADAETLPVVDGALALATLDNVLDREEPGDLEPVDASWSLTWRLPTEVVLVHALMRLGDRIVTSGAAHPFAPGTPPLALARSFAAMAGRTPRPAAVERAVALSAELAVPVTPWRRPVADREVGQAAQVARRPYGASDFHGLVELEEALDVATEQLGEAQEQVEWLLARVVKENRRRKAASIRAREAERRLGLRHRVARRAKASRAARVVEAATAPPEDQSARWSPPTDDGLAAEMEEVREEMDVRRQDGPPAQ